MHRLDRHGDSRAGALWLDVDEADGSRYASSGRYLAVEAPRRLVFELAALDEAGDPILTVVQQVSLTRRGAQTRLRARIKAADPTPEAAPAIAGIQLGWEQLLDKLAAHLAQRP